MNCPYCDSERIRVSKTINEKSIIKRYRHCATCNKYFMTTEIADIILKTTFKIMELRI